MESKEEIVVQEIPEEIIKEVLTREQEETKNRLAAWVPKTQLGKDVRAGKIRDIDEIFAKKLKILEPEIVDTLISPKSDLISIGQSKGKFGGGKRRAWRQTQRKTKEGNVPTFSAMAVVGDENGHVGIGIGKASETLPARDKALRKAKINLIQVDRSCASFDCACTSKHTIPYKVTGKGGSVRLTLIPAPQGTGLVAAKEVRKILKLAGIKDIYTKTFGEQRTSYNFVRACMDALAKAKIGDKK